MREGFRKDCVKGLGSEGFDAGLSVLGHGFRVQMSMANGQAW